MNINKNTKGFTLIEVMIAMFIFVIMISASIISLMNVFGAYGRAKEVQGHIDNSQFAMNLMMKSLRTSSLINNTGTEITIFDYSRNECVQYNFDSGSTSLQTRAVTSDYESCKTEGFGGVEFLSMTSGDVTGKFWASESDANNNVGSVTVLLMINKGEKTEVDIQSSVSLRDYKVSGIELGV
ncbi:MAG: type II secretion system GspH family protein [Candidatus Moranbacteria bacterium]|nr:type II secretion system GspH family protein [Candidatus Moranbacteria bacterium]